MANIYARVGVAMTHAARLSLTGATGLDYNAFFLAGLLGMASFGIAFNTAWGFFTDRENGIFYEMLTYPMNRAWSRPGRTRWRRARATAPDTCSREPRFEENLLGERRGLDAAVQGMTTIPGMTRNSAPLFVALLMAAVSPAFGQSPCEQLKSLALPAASVTAAEAAAAGPFRPAGAPPASPPLQVPAHCRVTLTLRPSADSDIKAEVWLPLVADWNGKFLMEGGGGFVGFLSYGAMTAALREGYATASTDTGHVGGDASFALGHPEKLVDFAWRAVHETAVKAKAVIAAHYGRGPRFSYWQGCSTGGRQGLMEAERHPADFDGIIAGAPANNQVALCAWRMAVTRASLMDPARALPPEKTLLVNNAVLDKCDALDGVRDRLLADPRKCQFDPATLICRGPDQPDCLTAGQLETVKMAYADARKKNGELIYPRLPPGGELGWRLPGGAQEPGGIDVGMFRFIGRQDAGWDWRAFDLERDYALAMEHGGFMQATNPDLSAFKARGGKLLIYHGWNDGGSGGAISALNSIAYYESVLARMGPKQGEWLRLFLVPGMAHCGGGTGPNQFSALAALERWRESGVAPDRILAARVTNGRVDMTRPLCPYPQVAVYRGTGSANDAGNFTCSPAP